MTPLPALIDAIDQADLPIAVYRTAVRLARMTGPYGQVVMNWDEYQALTGCGHADAARRHLRAMRSAGLITWRGGVTVVVMWSWDAQLVSENAHVVSESRQLLRVDNNTNGYYHEENAQLVSKVIPKQLARRHWHKAQRAVIVGKRAASVWNQIATVGKQTITARSLIRVRGRALVGWVDHSTDTEEDKTQPTNQPIPEPRARDENALALQLLLEVGVMPIKAKELAPLGFDLVRRAVANWWVQRKAVGGKLGDQPGVAVYWLENPGKRAFGPTLPDGWIESEIGRKYASDAERKRYTPGVYELAPTIQPQAPPKPLPPPMAHDDPWAVALSEMAATLTPTVAGWLEGSTLMANGELAGVPFYRLTVMTQPGNVVWLRQQAEKLIRKTVGSIVGKRIELEIVAAESEGVTP